MRWITCQIETQQSRAGEDKQIALGIEGDAPRVLHGNGAENLAAYGIDDKQLVEVSETDDCQLVPDSKAADLAGPPHANGLTFQRRPDGGEGILEDRFLVVAVTQKS